MSGPSEPMGTRSTATSAVRGGRRVDVSEMEADRVLAYARSQPGTDFHLERRGARTFLVASGR